MSGQFTRVANSLHVGGTVKSMSKVVVLGSMNQDLIAVCEAYPNRGETVRGLGLLRVPGGKGSNQAVAASCAGAESVIIGAVGADTAGEELISFLKSRNVETDYVRVDDVPTGTASITVDLSGEISIVAVAGANEKVRDDLRVSFVSQDVLVSPLEVPTDSIASFFQRGKAAGSTTILNASPSTVLPVDLGLLTDICVLNELELSSLTGIKPTAFAETSVILDAARCLRLPDEATVIVMRNGQAAFAIRRNEYTPIKGSHVKPVDLTGVEDCFVGSLAALLSEGENLEPAMQYANRAAAISSRRRGASMPSRAEVSEYLVD